MRNEYLKIKIKSLAAEARIIRQAELKAKKHMRETHRSDYKDEHRKMLMGLKRHRIGWTGNGGLRWETRHAHLAYAFLRDTPYRKLEERVHSGNHPDPEKIHKMVERFGGSRNAGEVEEWLKAA